MSDQKNKGKFSEISRRVARRLMLAGWFDALARSAPMVYVTAAVVAVALALSGVYYLGLAGAAALVLCHLLGTGMWVWLRRPSPTSALAVWDQRAGRKEMFTSAYCFERLPSVTPAQQLHLQVAGGRLDKDVSELPREIPTRLAHRAWITPLAFLVLAATALASPTSRDQIPVDDAAKQAARQVADQLANRTKVDDALKELTEDEREEIRDLENSIDDTVQKLQQLDDETRRDVLKELEQRAHAAEELAKSMSGAEGDPQSSELIAELSRHSDTTDFAGALKAEDLDKMESEAKRLAKRLDNKELTNDEKGRIQRAVTKSLERANKNDKKTELAKQLTKAKSDLQRNQPRLASKRFRELAKRYQRGLQRKQAQQRLQQLAKRLRSSGQNIFGPRQAGMRRLVAQRSPAGMQRLGSQQLSGRNPLLQRRPGALQGQLGRAAAGQRPMAGAQGPIPGQGQMPGAGQGQSPIPGLGQMPGGAPIPGQGNCPGGQCPVPGTGQGQGQGAGQGQGQGSGQGQGPAMAQAGMPGQGAGVGGHQAGHGSAALGGGAKSSLTASRTDRVNARISGQGPAQVRAIDPGERQEDTELSLADLATATISAEEEALADEPLPLSRRDQVLRYFTALRRQLATDEPSDN